MELKNSVVVITGSSSGIGAATAKALSKQGAKVALVARSKDKLVKLAESIGEQALTIVADVTVQEDVNRMVKEIIECFGHIDVLYVNAGMFISVDLAQGNPEHWAAGINLNITALCRTLKAVLPYMVEQRSGHVLITSSVAGHRWMKGQTSTYI